MKIKNLDKTFRKWINSAKIFKHLNNKKWILQMISYSFKITSGIWIKMSISIINRINLGIKTLETETFEQTWWTHLILKIISRNHKIKVIIKTFSNMSNLMSQGCLIPTMLDNKINRINFNNFKYIRNSWILKCSNNKIHSIFNTWIIFKILAATVNNFLSFNSLYKIIIIFKIFINTIMSRTYWVKWKMQLSIKLIWILIIWSILSKRSSSLSKYRNIKNFWNFSSLQIVKSDYLLYIISK
jgi:hypothetical protein